MEGEKKYSPEKVAAVKKKCQELAAKVKGDGSIEDMEIDQTINSLRASVGLYFCSFDESGCISCSG